MFRMFYFAMSFVFWNSAVEEERSSKTVGHMTGKFCSSKEYTLVIMRCAAGLILMICSGVLRFLQR